nr:leucine-rich repeat domain-containing protein [Hominisplanchenecus murintestinalis]
MTSIVIPDSVRIIEGNYSGYGGHVKWDGAFENCTSLKSLEILGSVTELEDGAFENCSSLTYLSIAEQCNGAAFPGCRNLTYFKIRNPSSGYKFSLEDISTSYHIEIMPGAKIIDELAFGDCKGLVGITIPDSVTKIEDRAFSSCEKLLDVTLPIHLTKISTGLFQECSSLKSIHIPDRVTEIGRYAFAGCSSLENVSIPNRVTEIGAMAFTYCDAMRSVTIPKSVSKIGENAFGFSKYVDGVDSSGNLEKGHWVRDKNFIIIGYPNTAAEKYAKENGIKFRALNTKKDNKVFKYAKSSYQPTGKRTAALIRVGNTGTVFKIPDTVKSNGNTYKVTSVGKEAFQDCKKLKSVVVGKNVTSIGSKAFSGCKALKKITIKSAKLKKVGKNAFKGIHAKAVIKAPKAKLKAYKKLLKKKGQGKKVRITK